MEGDEKEGKEVRDRRARSFSPSCSFARLAVLAVNLRLCLQCYRVTAGSDRPTSSASASKLVLVPAPPKFCRSFGIPSSFAASPSQPPARKKVGSWLSFWRV